MSRTAIVRVLHIEDDKEDQILVKDLLGDSKRTNFLLDTVETGATAEDRLRRERYDVVLLDYLLPDTTGLDFMKWFTKNHFRIPVVLITSHGDTRLQLEALEAGFCEYLEKGTFNAFILERTLMYAIGLHDKQSDAAGSNGVGMLIQELVGLTRESVTAQTRTAHEMARLRSELNSEVTHVRSDIAGVLREVRKNPWERMKDLLNWSVSHPWAIAFAFLGVLLLVSLSVLLLNVLDAEKMRLLKGDAPSATSNKVP